MSGKFHGRREDHRLVTGRGRYTSDWNFPDQVYAHFLRADRGHAEVRGVDVSAALATPGVLAVLTGADTKAAGFGAAPSLIHYPGKDGMKFITVHREVMAETRVRYVGQEVALVVATTQAIAQDAAEKIVVDYHDLPVVVDAEEALKPGAPLVWPGAPGNRAGFNRFGDAAKADGVIIYSIFLNVGGGGNSAPLSYCATDSTKYFMLTTTNAVVTTFNQIAQQITNVRVSN